MRKKKIVKQQWKEKHCKGCLWLTKEGLCPFLSCPRVFGWTAERKAVEQRSGGKYNE